VSPSLDAYPLVEPANRAQWRAWLAENHASSQGIWLAIGKKGNRVTELTYDDSVEEALCFGWIDSTARRLDESRYLGLFTPRKPRSVWAKSNKERIERLTAQGLMQPAGLLAVETAKANGSWSLLDDIDDLIVPADLAAALAARPRATEGFESLSAGQRRIALYWIASAQRAETRAKRVAETVSAAAEGRSPR